MLDEIYPRLGQLMERVAAAVELGEKGQAHCEERTSMMLYELFLEEIESKSKQQGAYYIRDDSDPTGSVKTPIGDYIARSPLFANSQAWADIFLRAGLTKRIKIEQSPFEDRELEAENLKGRMNRAALKERLLDGEPVLPAEEWLCCAPFFSFNYRVYDRQVSKTTVLAGRRFAGLWETAEEGPTEVAGTLVDICALLNSGGGVILFNTFRSYLELWPKGETIEQVKFAATRQLLTEILPAIHPAVRLDE